MYPHALLIPKDEPQKKARNSTYQRVGELVKFKDTELPTLSGMKFQMEKCLLLLWLKFIFPLYLIKPKW